MGRPKSSYLHMLSLQVNESSVVLCALRQAPDTPSTGNSDQANSLDNSLSLCQSVRDNASAMKMKMQ